MNAKSPIPCLVLSLLLVLAVGLSPAFAGAKLVVTKVSGPPEAYLNQTISVSCTVKNKGDEASGASNVRLYLSRDKTINPSTDSLLKKVAFASGLVPGESRKVTIKIAVPNSWLDGLAGDYYFGAVVAASKKASLNKVTMLRYKDNGDGTVSDFKTGLRWQQSDDGIKRSWSEAITYCTDLEFGGHDDWVLPPMEVLATIVDYTRYDPGCDPVFDCRSSSYWSSSTGVADPDGAWGVGFDGGHVDAGNKSYNDLYVRCVRSGP